MTTDHKILVRTSGGDGGSSVFPGRSDNVSPVGGGSQMQGGRPLQIQSGTGTIITAPSGGPNTPLKFVMVSITGPTSYTTGGDAPNWTQAGFASAADIVAVIPMGFAQVGLGNIFEYDHANNLMLVRQSAGVGVPLSQVANASNQSAVVFRALVIGT